MRLDELASSEILTEMLKDIETIEWHDLYDAEKNRALFKTLSANKYKKTVVVLNERCTIYKLRSLYFCLDTEHQRVAYYMHYQVGNNGKIGDYVWQSLVWSHEGTTAVRGIPQKMFIEQLLPKLGTIITDSEQSWDGKRFWKLRIEEAFETGLKVYYYDFTTHECVGVEDYSNFEAIEKTHDIWGKTDRHKLKRMVITKKELPLQKKK